MSWQGVKFTTLIQHPINESNIQANLKNPKPNTHPIHHLNHQIMGYASYSTKHLVVLQFALKHYSNITQTSSKLQSSVKPSLKPSSTLIKVVMKQHARKPLKFTPQASCYNLVYSNSHLSHLGLYINTFDSHPSNLRRFKFWVLLHLSNLHHVWDFRCVFNVIVYNKVYELCISCVHKCILFCLASPSLWRGPCPSNLRSPNRLIGAI